MSRVKIAFVGCGPMAAVYADRLKRHNDVELVGCHDMDADHAASFAASMHIPVFNDVVALYETGRPHAVYITVPPHARGDIELEATRRGIHFFLDVPIASDIKIARTINTAVAKSKVIAMAGYCRRYSELTQMTRNLLGGEVISLVSGRCYFGFQDSSGAADSYPRSGPILDQTAHVIDLLLYLCGPVSEVHALCVRGCLSRTNDFDQEESCVINLRLKSGAVASITATCVLNHPGGISLEIITPAFSLVLSDSSLRVQETHKTTDYFSQADMGAKETAAFIHALQQGKPGGVRATYREALKTLRVCLAARESIRTGLPVLL